MEMEMSLQAERRSKTLTPDTHKDERYWERRSRNNIAAKKSRDNRRNVENAIRQKAIDLENDNMLLRQELSVLKARFGIPESRSFLSLESHRGYSKMAGDAIDYSMVAYDSPTDSLAGSYFSKNFKRNAFSIDPRKSFNDAFYDGIAAMEAIDAFARSPGSLGSYRRSSLPNDDDQIPSDEVVYFYTKKYEPESSCYNVTSPPQYTYEDVFRDDCDYAVEDLSMKNRTRSESNERIRYGAGDAPKAICYEGVNRERSSASSLADIDHGFGFGRVRMERGCSIDCENIDIPKKRRLDHRSASTL